VVDTISAAYRWPVPVSRTPSRSSGSIVHRGLVRRRREFHLRPAQAIFVGFAVAIAVGTLLLMLPVSKAGPGGADFVEALFTSVSSVCVVGLALVDTPTFWSGFGLVVIVVLVQVGGFGIMTFASVIGLAVARRLSLRSKLTAGAEVRSVGLDDVKSLLLGVVRITFAAEAIVGVILAARFVIGYGYTATA
jgi:trk system potassium uptake protein TrkH